jgi:hypothetical protein
MLRYAQIFVWFLSPAGKERCDPLELDVGNTIGVWVRNVMLDRSLLQGVAVATRKEVYRALVLIVSICTG